MRFARILDAWRDGHITAYEAGEMSGARDMVHLEKLATQQTEQSEPEEGRRRARTHRQTTRQRASATTLRV